MHFWTTFSPSVSDVLFSDIYIFFTQVAFRSSFGCPSGASSARSRQRNRSWSLSIVLGLGLYYYIVGRCSGVERSGIYTCASLDCYVKMCFADD